mmetsp:Transcript_53767/g.78826  ORF Transcript_53767/g.78826 Transcript_53767/m.78826 type:complete len:218 (+) Transcript_53767:121-774(+)
MCVCILEAQSASSRSTSNNNENHHVKNIRAWQCWQWKWATTRLLVGLLLSLVLSLFLLYGLTCLDLLFLLISFLFLFLLLFLVTCLVFGGLALRTSTLHPPPALSCRNRFLLGVGLFSEHHPLFRRQLLPPGACQFHDLSCFDSRELLCDGHADRDSIQYVGTARPEGLVGLGFLFLLGFGGGLVGVKLGLELGGLGDKGLLLFISRSLPHLTELLR